MDHATRTVEGRRRGGGGGDKISQPTPVIFGRISICHTRPSRKGQVVDMRISPIIQGGRGLPSIYRPNTIVGAMNIANQRNSPRFLPGFFRSARTLAFCQHGVGVGVAVLCMLALPSSDRPVAAVGMDSNPAE